MNTRDTSGQFAVGNRGGPGRPPRQTERAYLETTLASCPLEAWRDIVARAVEDAKQGDAKARQFLADHLLRGTPPLSLLDVEFG